MTSPLTEDPPPTSIPVSPERAGAGLIAVRYGIGAVMVAGGILMLVLSPGGLGVDGFAMAVGGGLSVLMINALYRLGVSGDVERRREEEARTYFDAHGEWPPEEERPSGRRWILAPGVVTLEDELAAREREAAAASR